MKSLTSDVIDCEARDFTYALENASHAPAGTTPAQVRLIPVSPKRPIARTLDPRLKMFSVIWLALPEPSAQPLVERLTGSLQPAALHVRRLMSGVSVLPWYE